MPGGATLGPMPLVSVLIPNLDSPLLGEVLGAVLAEEADGVGLEVLVAGRDGPGLARAFPAVSLIETDEPVPPARARNLAVARARGELMTFLDADCLPEAGWLGRLVAVHREHPTGAVVGGSVRIDDDRGWAFVDNLSSFHAYLPTLPPSERPFLPALNLSAPASVVAAVGPFDEGLRRAEDLDWTLRARRAGWPLLFRPEVTVRHRSGRCTTVEVLRKALDTGRDAAAVRRRHGDLLPGSRHLVSRWALVLLAPAAATVASARAAAHAGFSPRAVAASPGVLATKLAWCAGGATRGGFGRSGSR